MNASAYLQKQGWRGEGYSLDQTDRGLAKPLLISRREDLEGLGKKKSYESTSNQWWLNAFDKSLKGLKAGGGPSGEAVEMSRTRPSESEIVSSRIPAQNGGLYGSFVKAETLKSTIDMDAMRQYERIGEAKAGGDAQSLQRESSSTSSSKGPVQQSEQKGKRKEKGSNDQAEDDLREAGGVNEDNMRDSKSKKRKHSANGNRENEAHQAKKAKSNDTHKPYSINLSDMAQDGDVHPESIAALRAQGATIEIPQVEMPPKDSRGWDYMTFLNKQQSHIDAIIARNKGREHKPEGFVLPPSFKQKNANKTSYKADKYQRESAKRVAKRLARHWQNVQDHPEMYYVDGTSIYTNQRRAAQKEQSAQKPVEQQEEQREKAEKDPFKEQMKMERRAAKKLRRAEKQRRKHETAQAHLSAKIEKQKREKDQADADARGLTLEAHLAEKEAKRIAKQTERDRAKAANLGITLEEFQNRKTHASSGKEIETQARELGISVQEYQELLAEVQEEDVGPEGEARNGSDITQSHGRNGFDKIWMRLKAKKEADDERLMNTQAPTHAGGSNKLSGDLGGDVPKHTHEGDETGLHFPPIPPQARVSGSAGEDFIPLFEGERLKSNEELGFAIDKVGDRSLAIDAMPAPILKIESTKDDTGRMDARNAEGPKKAQQDEAAKRSKKDKRKRRAEKKEGVLATMTNDLITMRRQQQRAQQELNDSGRKSGGNTRPIRISKGETKQARREARRIMRGMKKGRIPESEIPAGWEKYAPQKMKPKVGRKVGKKAKKTR